MIQIKLAQDYVPAPLSICFSVKWLHQTKKHLKKILKSFYKELYPRAGTEVMIPNAIWEKNLRKISNEYYFIIVFILQ